MCENAGRGADVDQRRDCTARRCGPRADVVRLHENQAADGSLSPRHRRLGRCRREFRHVGDFPPDAPLFPDGQTVIHRDGDTPYVYFATPFPLVRTRATVEAYRDLSAYEAYTCLKP